MIRQNTRFDVAVIGAGASEAARISDPSFVDPHHTQNTRYHGIFVIIGQNNFLFFGKPTYIHPRLDFL